jgi:deazaflavin-dependent oxidoreductase (nitroreductase family)
MRIEQDGSYAVVASNAGAPSHPSWYYSIVANALVELQNGATKREMRAREGFGEEKNEWWKYADPRACPEMRSQDLRKMIA